MEKISVFEPHNAPLGSGPEGDFTFEELKVIEGTGVLPATLGI